ncbi:MAG: PAS domain S-box protein [Isosphaeraceae bacterium]
MSFGRSSARPTAIWIAEGKNCAVIRGNPVADRLLGIEPGLNVSATAPEVDPPSRGFMEYRGGQTVDPADLPLQRAAALGVDVVGEELTFRFNDGSVRHVYGNASPLRNSRGEVYGAISAFIDITTLKEAQEALRANEERFQLASEAVNGLIYDWDRRTSTVTRSAGLFDVVGFHPHEVPPDIRWWRDRINPDDRKAGRGDYEHVIAARKPFHEDEYRVRHRDGSWRHVWDRARLVYDEEGRPVRIVGYTLDVTDRVKNQEALRESERRYRKLATSDVIGIIFGDIHGGLSHVNDVFLRTLGYTREEFESKRLGWVDITPSEWLQEDWARIAAAQEGTTSPPYEKEYFHRDGSRVPVLIGFTLLSEDADDVVAFVLDLTERKRAERALKEADRRKDEFLAMLAHELRNPLAAIATAAHILQAKGPPDPELKWGRDVIIRQVQHLSRLIEDLLDVSRITTGKIKLRTSPLDVRTVINLAAESIQPTMAQKRHELRIILPPHPLPVLGDASRLEQVLSNLLTNAAKFTDEGGSIQVSGGKEGDHVVVRVRDNGIGISREAIAHVFELFAQVDRGSDRTHGGLGIGLALVRSLMKMHGGDVAVASEGLGRGTEFTLRLPSLSPSRVVPETPKPDSEVPTVGQSMARVLVVDDNQDIARGLTMMLETAGHRVLAASDGLTALRAARDFRPEFVLLDIGLPGLDGYEVAKAIRRECKDPTPVLIAISGYGQEGHRARAREAGFDHHLLKPVDASALLPLLQPREKAQ